MIDIERVPTAIEHGLAARRSRISRISRYLLNGGPCQA